MHRNKLRRIAIQVWGKGWAWELARALGRHPVTVRRWQAGITTMGEDDHYAVVAAFRRHSAERHQRVVDMCRKVKNRGGLDTYMPIYSKPVKRARDPVPPWKKQT